LPRGVSSLAVGLGCAIDCVAHYDLWFGLTPSPGCRSLLRVGLNPRREIRHRTPPKLICLRKNIIIIIIASSPETRDGRPIIIWDCQNTNQRAGGPADFFGQTPPASRGGRHTEWTQNSSHNSERDIQPRPEQGRGALPRRQFRENGQSARGGCCWSARDWACVILV
jgi:hypothetical protein